MIGFDEAMAVLLRESQPLPVQQCRLQHAHARVLAADVCSGEDLPPFDNAAMDGFALRSNDAVLPAESCFDVIGAQAAGDRQTTGNGVFEIMTGARLPDGLDSVVPVEQVEVLARDAADRPLRIRLMADVEPEQHVRLRGEDVARGAPVLTAGTRITAPQHMLLAAVGVAEVAVAAQPRVALLNTGRELVDDPDHSLASGEIRNSNGPYLAARVIDAGAELVLRETVGDDPAAFLAAMARVSEAGADVVISTGAVSMGRHDFVPDALRSLGAKIHFHKVRIRPGKPLLFATLADGRLFFGLPGNPVSSAVGLRFFVEPVLRALAGLPPEQALRVPLAAPFSKRAPLRFHLKGQLEITSRGQLQARALAGQESFRIRPMAEANCWIVLDEAHASPQAGDMVEVYGLGHLLAPQIRSAGEA